MAEQQTIERVRLIIEYDIGYESEAGREEAIKAALAGSLDMRGSGPNGVYSAKRLGCSGVVGDD